MRIDPQVGPENYKTYQIVAPASTHTRRAGCEEVECHDYRNGWVSLVAAGGEHDLYIRHRSGRSFTSEPQPGGMVRFRFAPGQPCFRAADHRVPLEREPLYLVRGGDYRGNPRGIQTVQRKAEEWVDDFATHQQNIATAIERG